MCRPSATFAVWSSAWLNGAAASDDVLDALLAWGEAWGEGTAYVIDQGQQYTFAEGMRDYRYDPIAPADEFDRWCFDRNRREDAAMSARYVSPEVVGYSDLDEYGTWRDVEGYGQRVETILISELAELHRHRQDELGHVALMRDHGCLPRL